MTLLSIVMPVRNGERFLAESLASISAQTHEDWELVVVDDASDDATAAQLQAFRDPRVRILRNDEPRGVAASLNRALGQAQGEILVRMDADDRMHADRLAVTAEQFGRHDELDALATWFTYMDAEGRPIPTGPLPAELGSEALRLALLVKNPLCHPAVALHRRVAGPGLYDEGFRCEDHHLWLTRSGSWSWKVLPAPMVEWRMHSTNTSKVDPLTGLNQLAPVVASEWAALGLPVDEDTIRCILMPSLAVETGRAAEASEVLAAWAALVRDVLDPEQARFVVDLAATWHARVAVHLLPRPRALAQQAPHLIDLRVARVAAGKMARATRRLVG